ncbi:MAG: PEP-CTERM sorting domain-containing protein [Planctomycetes bacterium]|nr:PEP-CTERM sorting domain-containing protein [Planctomycetota bacterium]
MRGTLRATVILLSGLLSGEAILAETPTFRGLGDLAGGGVYSAATDVSANGAVVVGSGASAVGTEAMRWSESEGAQTLGLGTGSRAYGVSADGSVTVGYGAGGGFLRDEGTGTVIRLGTHAYDVSGDGTVVAGYEWPNHGEQAFRWTQAGGVELLGYLPGGSVSRAWGISRDGTVVVGEANGTLGWEAFRWDSGTGIVGLGSLPGGSHWSWARDVSADGSVVVGESESAEGQQAFRWTSSSGMVALGDLPGGSVYSNAFAVSADGSIVLGTGRTAQGNEAFIWDASHGMRNLRGVLTAEYGLDLTGWTLTAAWGISDNLTTITGTGKDPQGSTAAWIAVIPEPGTLALVALGLGALAVGRRTRP